MAPPLIMLALCAAVSFIQGAMWTFWSPAHLKLLLGASDGTLALLAYLNPIAYLVALPATVILLRRIGLHAGILASTTLAAISGWVRYFTLHNFVERATVLLLLDVAQFMNGLAAPFCFMAAPLASRRLPRRHRMVGMALASTNFLGQSAAHLFGPAMVTSASGEVRTGLVRYTLACAVLASALSLVCFHLLASAPSVLQATATKSTKSHRTAPHREAASAWRDAAAVVTNPLFGTLSLCLMNIYGFYAIQGALEWPNLGSFIARPSDAVTWYTSSDGLDARLALWGSLTGYIGGVCVAHLADRRVTLEEGATATLDGRTVRVGLSGSSPALLSAWAATLTAGYVSGLVFAALCVWAVPHRVHIPAVYASAAASAFFINGANPLFLELALRVSSRADRRGDVDVDGNADGSAALAVGLLGAGPPVVALVTQAIFLAAAATIGTSWFNWWAPVMFAAICMGGGPVAAALIVAHDAARHGRTDHHHEQLAPLREAPPTVEGGVEHAEE